MRSIVLVWIISILLHLQLVPFTSSSGIYHAARNYVIIQTLPLTMLTRVNKIHLLVSSEIKLQKINFGDLIFQLSSQVKKNKDDSNQNHWSHPFGHTYTYTHTLIMMCLLTQKCSSNFLFHFLYVVIHFHIIHQVLISSWFYFLKYSGK